LDQIGLFIGATAGRNHADRMTAMFFDNPAHAFGGKLHCLIPRHFLPRIVDILADHWVQDAVLVRRIAIGKTALNAGMATVRLAMFIGNHADQFSAAQFRLE